MKLDNVDSASDSSRVSSPIQRSYSVRERSRHESTEGEFQGIHIGQRRGSMTINCPHSTKGQRGQIPESFIGCATHNNSVSPSVSKQEINSINTHDTRSNSRCDYAEVKQDTIVVKNKENVVADMKIPFEDEISDLSTKG